MVYGTRMFGIASFESWQKKLVHEVEQDVAVMASRLPPAQFVARSRWMCHSFGFGKIDERWCEKECWKWTTAERLRIGDSLRQYGEDQVPSRLRGVQRACGRDNIWRFAAEGQGGF